jgi:hypothetical protein
VQKKVKRYGLPEPPRPKWIQAQGDEPSFSHVVLPTAAPILTTFPFCFYIIASPQPYRRVPCIRQALARASSPSVRLAAEQ